MSRDGERTATQTEQMIVQRNDAAPGTFTRLIALLVCPVYLLMVASGFSSATQTPLTVTLPTVLICAAAIIGVLVAFGVKAYRHDSRRLRFNLSTVLLFMVPVCIYLMAFQQILHAIPLGQRDVYLLVTLSGVGLFLACLTTAILLYFAEAVMWLGLGIVRWRTRAGENR